MPDRGRRGVIRPVPHEREQLEMLRVGIIGCGASSSGGTCRDFWSLTALCVSAPCRTSQERVGLLADRAKVGTGHRYKDYRELLDRETLDLTIVATPLAYHEDPVVYAAGRVPTVLVEKPLATDLAVAERMMSACQREGTRLCVVHNQLFRPAVEVAARLLATGDYGRPFLYRDELLGASHRPGSGIYPDWRTQRAHSGGGCLIDNAYHSIYIAERLLGAPVTSVQARTSTFTHDYDVEDTALVVMEHRNGALSSVQASWSIVAGRHVPVRP